jgi:membrane-associated protein
VTVQALPGILDGQQLVETVGFVGLLLIVFAETGLLLGFFLPGDSLLFAAGYAATGGIPGLDTPPLWAVCLAVTLVAIAGAQTGYAIGAAAGPRLFDRQDSRLFRREYVEKAQAVVERYGAGKAIVLARFIPIVRTFLNPLMGMSRISARDFFVWNVVGGVLWGTGVTLLGYYLGQVDVIGKNLEVFAVLVVLLSVIPMALELRRSRKR